MINNRLIHIMGKSRKYVSAQVLFQWISLLCNIVLMSGIALFLASFLLGETRKCGKNDMDSSVCPGHTVRMYNPGKPDESSRRKASKRTAAYYDL